MRQMVAFGKGLSYRNGMIEILAIDFAAGLPRLVEGLSRWGQVSALSFAQYTPGALSAFADRARVSGSVAWVHPGSSPLAESVAFAQQCTALGLVPLMPSSKSLAWATHGLHVLQQAERVLGAQSTLLLHGEPLAHVREVERVIETQGLGFPFVLRSAQGGGGQRGIWVVRSGEELREKGPSWFEQIRSRFEIPLVFIERVLSESRHWVLPFVRYATGEIRWLGISEASLQWRCRKIIEWFAPWEQMEFGLSQELGSRMREMGRRVLEEGQFVGVGAVEFLSQDRAPYLVGVIARLTRHWFAWSESYGVDPIELQMEVARQIPEASPPRLSRKWAAVARIIAEDPLLEIPRPGAIYEWERPDLWVGIEDTTPVDFGSQPDGTLGWLMATGQSRHAVADLLRVALSKLWIAGTTVTNERHLRELLEHPWVREGMFHAGFVDEEFLPRLAPDRSWETWLSRLPERPGPQPAWTPASGSSVRVSAYPLTEESSGVSRWRIRAEDWFLDLRAPGASVNVKNASLPVRALCCGRLRQCLARPGMLVSAHSAVCMIESAGSWVPHPLPRPVHFEKWTVQVGDVVQEGQILGWVSRPPKN